MTCIEKAKVLLEAENCTCVLYKDALLYKSQRRGVAPLLQLPDEGADVSGAAAADRVVGKATAFLYCLLGVAQVHAQVMSKPAATVLAAAGIDYSCEQLVDGIQNRQKDGPCPMEHATQNCKSAAEALVCIRETLQRLQQKES